MGIPKKKSRKIVVDGYNLRYAVKETHIPEHKDQKELSITIQEDVDNPSGVCQFRENYGAAITPKYMEERIKEALQLGWDPKTSKYFAMK